MNIVITGASRGIGLELAKQYLSRGDVVYAAVRTPENAKALAALQSGNRLRVMACDVANHDSVKQLAKALTEVPVDILVNNAGIWGGQAQSVGNMDFAQASECYETNALGPLRVALALLPNLQAGAAKRMAHITSGLASISDNTSGGWYGYRMSKAALNMMSRSLAKDLAKDKMISVVVDPGWVKTDMGGAGAPTEASDSATGIITVIDKVTLAQSGEFLHWRGDGKGW